MIVESRMDPRGFTLIELMIVVVIISLIAAVAIPQLLSVGQNAADSVGERVELAQRPPSATVIDEDGRSLPVEILAATIDVLLTTEPVLSGFSVYTSYHAEFSGRFVIRNPLDSRSRVSLDFPFPPGMTQAENVSLLFEEADGELHEASGATYGINQIHWEDTLAPNELATAVVRYEAQGRERFVYDVTSGTRSGEVTVHIRLDGVGRAEVPVDALQPTDPNAEHLVWSFEHLITNRPIQVDLPAGSSPLGQVILLCQLAGLGVLLFGAGFWYLSEGDKPGAMDEFRWGHFLLLALNYALFFGVIAVVGYGGALGLGLALATIIGLPLLGLHVTRISGREFTLRKALPLAAFVNTMVVCTVLFEGARAYVLLASSVMAIGFTTVTFRAWAEGRLKHSEAMQRQRSRARILDEITELEGALLREVEQAEVVREEAETLVQTGSARATEATDGLQEPLEVALQREVVQNALDQLTAVLEEREGLETEPDWDSLVKEDPPKPPQADERRALDLAAQRFANQRQTAIDATARETNNVRRHLAELDALERSAREAQRRAEVARRRTEAERARQESEPESESERLEADPEGVETTEHRHCPSCGAGSAAAGQFCATCGAAQPIDVKCLHCQTITSLPVEVMSSEWTASTYHCHLCGHALETSPALRQVVGLLGKRRVGSEQRRST